MSDRPTRKPPWLRVSGFSGQGFEEVTRILKSHGLNTVCQEANCPNRGECFNRGTATFLIMGPTCTRNCRFCDIRPGEPKPLDPEEPARLAEVASLLKLRHVVVTSVTRDDLPDGGVRQFAETVRRLRERLPEATVEILTPDFRGVEDAVAVLVDSRPDVFNHNIETVPRLYPAVRPGADYRRSLDLLRAVADRSDILTKSGVMLGMGETLEELEGVFEDLARCRVSLLTIGQYLAPSRQHFPVVRYLTPAEFADIGRIARRSGIAQVMSGPLVRSSYRADESLSVPLTHP